LSHPAPSAEGVLALAQHTGLRLSPAQADALWAYLQLLQRWNSTHNLTAVRTMDGMWTQHLADCLAAVVPMQARMQGHRVLDVGSGGGLPGVVLAVCLPGHQISCVDTVGKKAAFVRQVAGELRLPNLHSVHARVEALPAQSFDTIVCRAFATLGDFVRLTRGQLAPAGVWMAMKGQQPDDEIADLPADVAVFHVEHLQVPGLDAQRCLVWMRPRPDLQASGAVPAEDSKDTSR
jgi:16S rRNA (guanine527-N7)-methyltransferase